MLSFRNLLSIALPVTVLLALTAASAAAAPATYDGISANGKVALFSTREEMVPGDTDQELDIYERTLDPALGEYVTREVSIGPSGGNDTLPALYDDVSADGEEVFFSTKEGLVPGDKDHREDVYVRNLISNQTFLVSAGAGANQGVESCAAQACGTGPYDAGFVPGGVPEDGGKVFFVTAEKLVAADKDEAVDVYMRDLAAGTTVLVSAGDPSCASSGCGNGTKATQFLGTDKAGDKAFLVSSESLEGEDADANPDIYARDLAGGTTSLVSAEGPCPSGLNCNPTFGGASVDGSHVFFESNEQIAEADEDSSQDVYDWSGSGEPVLVSTGPDGGNGPDNATYAGSSADGSKVFFQTSEVLDASADEDQALDVYERVGGTTTSLVSAGEPGHGNEDFPATFSWASADGSTVVFKTLEQLTESDGDEAVDVYKRAGGVTTLVSTGAEASGGDFEAAFAGASSDGSKIFFLTPEALSSQDEDESSDIYVRSAAGTALVSTGLAGGNGEYSSGLHGVSADGSRAFFVTQERLTFDDDFLEEDDVYSWTTAGTLLVSVKNDATLVLGPPPPTLEATNPTSPGLSTQPRVIGQSVPGALIKIYATSNCSKEPVAQGTAEELASPGLLAAPVAEGSTTEYRATAEAEGIVSVCSKPIPYEQETPAPPTEEGGGSGGGGTNPGTGTGGTGTQPSGGTAGGSKGGGTSGGTHHGGIAYVVPLVRITFAPGSKTRQRRPTFRFDDSTGQPDTRFFCRVDKTRWSACGSPMKLKRLRLGRHVFTVKGVNALGVAGPAPVKRAFKVVAR